MELTKFNEKLNKVEGNIYTVEEVVTPIDGVYEADLAHDNIDPNTLNIHTGSKLTGDKINTYTISTPSLTPWRTHIKIFSTEPTIYISYETTGDIVEADDINNVQNAINLTQEELNKKADKGHTHAISEIEDMPTNLSQFNNDAGYITATDIDLSQNHIHSNKTVLDKITQNDITNWNNKLQTKRVTTVTDFNILKETCVYYIKVSNCPNNPSSKWGTLFVSNEGNLYQIFIPDTSGAFYKRNWSSSSSAWGSWVDLRATDSLGNQINTTYVKKAMTWNELEGV